MEKIPKGFKLTEIGILPEDWEVVTLGSQCQIFGRIGFRGYTINDIVQEGQGAISISPSNIINGKLDLTKSTYISWFKYEESPEIKIYNGDILLVKTGSTYGKTAIVRDIRKKATLNPQVIVLKKTKCNNIFLGYMVAFPFVQNQIESSVVGGAIPTLSQQEVANFKIPLPSLSEQQAIAAALSAVDELIQTLEKQIQKKKALKQGAMHLLLSPKEGWEEVCFDDILDYEQPQKYLVNSEILKRGKTPVLTANKSFLLGYTEEDFGIYIETPVIIFDDFTVLNKKVTFPFKIKSSAIKLLKPKKDKCNLDFVYAIMSMVDFSIGDHKRYYLSEYRYLKIFIPPLSEQQEIASILSDMDAEIEALAAKKQKYQAIKQAMMQALLTGKTRLTGK